MTDDGLTGRSARLNFTVGQQDLATVMGSGDVPVLGTPRLIAWLEAASVAAVADALPARATSVGTMIEVEHLAASGVGVVVAVSATVTSAAGKVLVFDCEAVASASSTVIGRGTIARVVVDRERFVARVAST